MKAIIRIDVPKCMIGEKVMVYFPGTMCKEAVCEAVPGTARWVVSSVGDSLCYYCSNCKYIVNENVTKIDSCPKCGALITNAKK